MECDEWFGRKGLGCDIGRIFCMHYNYTWSVGENRIDSRVLDYDVTDSIIVSIPS